MTDKELLFYAAKAFGDAPQGFSPIIDDGDALRLAVKLGIYIKPGAFFVETVGLTTEVEATDNDPYAATRRAIVRAAAEIGKDMK